MSLNWSNLISLNGSQHNAFEELVCQLADSEFTSRKKFVRIAAPDGGIEAYCEFDNGEIYGWQAKFFLNSLGSSQWTQVQDSFYSALENYPNLTKYYICIPVDRNNPVIPGKKSFLDRWNEKIEKWKQYATEKGRSIEFEFWGSFELFDRLSYSQNSGKKSFWFNESELSNPKWFKDKLNQTINNLGARYTPELHVDMPISMSFYALRRDVKFKEYFLEKAHQAIIHLDKKNKIIKQDFSPLNGHINCFIDRLREELNLNTYKTMQSIPDASLLKEIDTIYDELNRIYSDIKERISEFYEKLNDLYDALNDISVLLKSSLVQLFNGKTLLLHGDAGMGKSHTIADFLKTKIEANVDSSFPVRSLLLLGQDFTEESNVWHQILTKQLNLSCSEIEFLEVLESIAQTKDQRFILAIDALNEGAGRKLWSNNLNGFLDLLKNYPRIGLILSVRNTYKNLIIDDLTSKNKTHLCKVPHSGFSGMEYEAMQGFFTYYGIQSSNAPILNPEFTNPLYLKLYCEGLVNNGLRTIPKGYGGLNQIFNNYLQGVEYKVTRILNLDSNLSLVNRAVRKIVELQIEQQTTTLDYLEVRRILYNEFKIDIAEDEAKRFLDTLINEGICAKDVFIEDHSSKDLVYFIYDKLGEFFIATYLFNKVKTHDDLAQWIEGKIKKYHLDSYRGLWDIWSILIPEKFGLELFELVSDAYRGIFRLYVITLNNLFWRDVSKIDPSKFKDRFEKNLYSINQNNPILICWIEIIYQLASEIDHPFNIDFLSNYLFKMSLADRDCFWTSYISVHDVSSIERLLKWCESNDHDNTIYDEKSLLHIATALCWLLTTTNIQRRIKVINVLAKFLVNKTYVSYQLINRFKTINDPYIFEGILASTYGALSYGNAQKNEDLQCLIEEIDNSIFQLTEVYPHILIRDHGIKIIDFCLNHLKVTHADKEALKERISYPFNSVFPTIFPSNEELDNAYQKIGQKTILYSMTTEYGRGVCSYGDFGRYVFQSSFYPWRGKDNLINVDLLSNHACYLIFEKYGYDENKHGDFDRSYAQSQGRFNASMERIGKKYQWLAMYEVLARVMDNKQCKKDQDSNDSELIWLDDISEFHIPKVNISLDLYDKKTLNYNLEISLNEIKWKQADNHWIQSKEDIKQISSLLEIDFNGDTWVILEAHLDPKPTDDFGIDNSNCNKRLWFQIRSYFTLKRQYSHLMKELNDVDYMGRWMPEGAELFNKDIRSEYLQEYQDPLKSDKWINSDARSNLSEKFDFLL